MPAPSNAAGTAAKTVKSFGSGAARVRCYLIDGDERDIALGAGRYRWQKFTSTLAAYDWLRLEVLDKLGAVVGVYDHPDGGRKPGDLETLGVGTTPAGVGVQHQLLQLMLSAQSVALAQQRDLVDRVVTAQTAALDAATQRLVGVERQIGMLMKLVQRSTTENVELSSDIAELIADAAAAGGEGADDQMDELKATVFAELAKKLLTPAPAPAVKVTTGANGV